MVIEEKKEGKEQSFHIFQKELERGGSGIFDFKIFFLMRV